MTLTPFPKISIKIRILMVIKRVKTTTIVAKTMMAIVVASRAMMVMTAVAATIVADSNSQPTAIEALVVAYQTMAMTIVTLGSSTLPIPLI